MGGHRGSLIFGGYKVVGSRNVPEVVQRPHASESAEILAHHGLQKRGIEVGLREAQRLCCLALLDRTASSGLQLAGTPIRRHRVSTSESLADGRIAYLRTANTSHHRWRLYVTEKGNPPRASRITNGCCRVNGFDIPYDRTERDSLVEYP